MGCLQGVRLRLYRSPRFSSSPFKVTCCPSLLQMGSLPSFIDLMDSLGLEQAKQAPTADQSPSPPPSSPRPSTAGWKNAPTRSSSSPSLRDVATLHHISRYSPYPSALVRYGGISFNKYLIILPVPHSPKTQFITHVFFVGF